MLKEPTKWPTEAFLKHFMRIEKQMPERAFAFILGAGASVSSKLPTGAALVDDWLADIHLRHPEGKNQPIEEWATEEQLKIDGFTYERRAEFYPQIYELRFGDDLEEGYAYLEDIMKDAEPGLGYSMLAQILAKTRHKLVITTNFDNLVADSVLIFTNQFAQICGHESLTGFIRVQPRRPLVAKIHRDLLLGPQNDPYDTNLLHEDWARALRKMFARYTPLVIGYGGNDGSLMNFLEALKPGSIPGGIFWFHMHNDQPNDRICHLVARHSGKLVPIRDFDTFMFQLAAPLELGLLDAQIVKEAEERAQRLRDQWDSANESLKEQSDDPLAHEAFEKVETRRVEAEDDWWSWIRKAQREADLDKREKIYRQGLERFPDSAELTGNFALFMYRIRKDDDKAESLYRKALQLDPNNARTIGNFAAFLHDIRKDYNEAESLYRKALQLDPNYANAIGNFALFMYMIRKDDDEAESLYRKALQLNPNHVTITGNFAAFVFLIRKDYDEAESLYRKALQLDLNHALNTASFTAFLIAQGRLPEAKKMSDRAWKLAKEDLSQVAAEVALYRGLMLKMGGKNDDEPLGRLKTLLRKGFTRVRTGFTPAWWSFDDVLSAVNAALDENNKKLYAALVDAIVDAEKVAALDAFPRWQEVEEIPLDEPWQPLAE